MEKTRTKLYNILVDRFDEGELRTLCFHLGEHYDNLPGDGKIHKARELIDYLKRRNRLVELVDIGKQLRPDISWVDITAAPEKVPSNFQSTVPEQLQIEFMVQEGDVTTFDADVVALKFAQGSYGADEKVAMALDKDVIEFRELLPTLGAYKLFHTLGKIKAQRVLFLSVPILGEFRYQEIRKFSRDVLEVLANDAPYIKHLAMTIHGVGYGLDETESLRAQLAGYLDAFDSNLYPPTLERITIVDRNRNRAQRLQAVLDQAIPGNFVMLPKISQGQSHSTRRSPFIRNVGRKSTNKPHVLVAIIPPTEEMEDVYYYGIQAPVNAAGYLCERVDLLTTGADVFERTKSQIETASYFIVELTTTNPIIFLLVGYAWGKERATILLAQDAENLLFDDYGQRCLVYNRIRDLEESLTKELQ